MLRIILLAFALTLSAVPVAANPFEDGVAAHKLGDYETAMRLLRPLAEQGNAYAQYKLGAMYDEGQGVPQDHAEATKWDRLNGAFTPPCWRHHQNQNRLYPRSPYWPRWAVVS